MVGVPLYLRTRVLSVMRWRNRETEGVSAFMPQLPSESEADCLARQHDGTRGGTSNHDAAGANAARSVWTFAAQ